jgi:hypothetical protein
VNVAGHEKDLTNRKCAAALVALREDETTIYWYRDGLCCEIERAASQALAHAMIEERHLLRQI